MTVFVKLIYFFLTLLILLLIFYKFLCVNFASLLYTFGLLSKFLTQCNDAALMFRIRVGAESVRAVLIFPSVPHYFIIFNIISIYLRFAFLFLSFFLSLHHFFYLYFLPSFLSSFHSSFLPSFCLFVCFFLF